MNFRECHAVVKHSTSADVALLLIRIIAGVAFMYHGWGKIQNPFGWMGEESWAPGILQALAALAEFGGGLAWVLGLLTPLASLGMASTMLVAVWTHAVVKGDPFVGRGGSWELAAVYFGISMLLLAMSPGRLSLDHKIFGTRT